MIHSSNLALNRSMQPPTDPASTTLDIALLRTFSKSSTAAGSRRPRNASR